MQGDASERFAIHELLCHCSFDSDSGKSSAGRCRNWSGGLLILKLNFRMRWSMFSGGMPPFSNSKPRCRFLSPSVHARSCPARYWHVAFLKAQHPQVFAGERCRIKYHWCLTRQGSCSSTAAASFNCCCQEAVSNSKINMSHSLSSALVATLFWCPTFHLVHHPQLHREQPKCPSLNANETVGCCAAFAVMISQHESLSQSARER